MVSAARAEAEHGGEVMRLGALERELGARAERRLDKKAGTAEIIAGHGQSALYLAVLGKTGLPYRPCRIGARASHPAFSEKAGPAALSPNSARL